MTNLDNSASNQEALNLFYVQAKKMVNKDQPGKKFQWTWFELCRAVLELLALALILAVLVVWVNLYLAMQWWDMVKLVTK